MQEAQSGATTDAAKEAADRLAAGKLAAEQADLQRKFLAELLKRERLAVQSFCVFLELLPKSIHLDEPGETARSAAVSAAANLDAVLGIGEQMMAAHHG